MGDGLGFGFKARQFAHGAAGLFDAVRDAFRIDAGLFGRDHQEPVPSPAVRGFEQLARLSEAAQQLVVVVLVERAHLLGEGRGVASHGDGEAGAAVDHRFVERGQHTSVPSQR